MGVQKADMAGLDRSTLFLIFSNLVTLVVALLEGWELPAVIWVYWAQSAMIGYYNFRRMLSLKEYQSGLFFMLHYGIFHLAYLFFLFLLFRNVSALDAWSILVCVAFFGLNHRFSFRQKLEADRREKPKIKTLMAFPYARVLPMHATIILGSLFAGRTWGPLVLFLCLKMIVDVVMHRKEQRLGRTRH